MGVIDGKLQIPKYPVVFVKPPDALAGPYDKIHIHPEVQHKLDYEGELTVIIGRDAKNVPAARALDYVLGYTVGNDLSARDFQTPVSVSGGQFCYAKSFDQFAPIGPCIASTACVPDPQNLNYYTKVNGETRQRISTSDMVWTVSQIIEHLSRGTTLRSGTFIMTGTPSGVGLFMQPPQFLKDGDVIEIGIDGIGAITNTIVFD
jgi:transcription initiation factor TFIIH subunit 2